MNIFVAPSHLPAPPPMRSAGKTAQDEKHYTYIGVHRHSGDEVIAVAIRTLMIRLGGHDIKRLSDDVALSHAASRGKKHEKL